MKTQLDILIHQLDSLIPFIAISRKDVFDLLNRERTVWFPNDPEALPRAYDLYRKQINHAAIILGYSYFENFLNDLLFQILRVRPAMLPGNKEMKYSEIIGKESIDYIIEEMIKKELSNLMYKSMADIVGELKEKYNFTIDDDQKEMLCKFSIIRNCIIHNSSCADKRLAEYDGFELNNEFELDSSTIHNIGLKLRNLVRNMYREAQVNHLNNL
jgi:hypothetical protein